MKYFSNSLTRNIITKNILKKIIPIKLRRFILININKDNSIKIYYGNNVAIIDNKYKKIEGLIPVYYYDDVSNFGDLVGPYLISKITGKPVINIRNSKYPGIMAVGSILNTINRNNMVVWGSGLIGEPTDEFMEKLRKYDPKFLSVRGLETAKLLSEANINIPGRHVYGDPALILPLFYTPSTHSSKEIGICPHYIHKSHFLENINKKEWLKIIDVQEDMESVVDSIVSSSVCISTSLHGLIIAQAYGIPWVWLEIVDDNLTGRDFKFRDFFSTIDISQVTHIKSTMEKVKDLDFEAIAQSATLPNKLYDEVAILEAFKEYIELDD